MSGGTVCVACPNHLEIQVLRHTVHDEHVGMLKGKELTIISRACLGQLLEGKAERWRINLNKEYNWILLVFST